MDKKKTSLSKDVEDTIACSAFAEAGEPCPIHEEKRLRSRKTPKIKGWENIFTHMQRQNTTQNER